MSMKKGIQAMAFMTLGSAAVVYKVTNITTTTTTTTTTIIIILANTDNITNDITLTIAITTTTRSTSLKPTSVWRCGRLCTWISND
jgi:hypothetical protein